MLNKTICKDQTNQFLQNLSTLANHSGRGCRGRASLLETDQLKFRRLAGRDPCLRRYRPGAKEYARPLVSEVRFQNLRNSLIKHCPLIDLKPEGNLDPMRPSIFISSHFLRTMLEGKTILVKMVHLFQKPYDFVRQPGTRCNATRQESLLERHTHTQTRSHPRIHFQGIFQVQLLEIKDHGYQHNSKNTCSSLIPRNMFPTLNRFPNTPHLLFREWLFLWLTELGPGVIFSSFLTSKPYWVRVLQSTIANDNQITDIMKCRTTGYCQ